MSARPVRPVSLLLALSLASACVHTGPAALPAVRTPSAHSAALVAPVQAPVPAAPPAVVYPLRWQLRVSDATPWTSLPATLHTFSVARWECALGAAEAATTEAAAAAGPLPTGQQRKLACTHASGATLQTRLVCASAAGDARELELALDMASPLRLSCETEPAPEL